MTFGKTTLGRTMSRTRLLLKKQLWIWPIVAVVLLAAVGYAISNSIHRTMDIALRSDLQTLLNVERAMLEKWFKVQESNAATLANSQGVRDTISQILKIRHDSLRPQVEVSSAERDAKLAELYAKLATELEPSMSSHDFVGYVIADKRQQIIAAFTSELIGKTIPQYQDFLTQTLEGRPTVSTPLPSEVMLKDKAGNMRSGTPTMFVCAPVRDNNMQIIAALAMRIRPEKEFTEILQLGRIGETGETYAINKDGLMVSNSRFDRQLMLLGLLPDEDAAASILTIKVRNPGGSLMEGYRPNVLRRDLPLTEIAAAAVSGTEGIKMNAYRDYRGSPSLGAWAWLPAYQMGIITEIDAAEAYLPLTILKRSFYALYALLGVSALAIFVFTLVVARLQRQAQKAEIEAKQLGQYRLKEKIGAGAMGVVYRGEHAMLRRPTAIKMLDVDRTNDASVQRFEREVQTTCNLNNTHTVAIYDYGRTPEGVFYYAMEYLDGIDLETLIEKDGPQPEGRVVYILRQVCASLYEAHSMGLVHRDIKPANIMLNRRGGESDFVKVLDFGLVKSLDDKINSSDVSGTPLYMSPESIQTPDLVDARSDLYAVGAVGYFLLTGQTVFNAKTLGELCQQQIAASPDPPSKRLDRPVSAELEHAILGCLEKNRAKRPQTARDLEAMLDRVQQSWSRGKAETWWSRYERGDLRQINRAGSRSAVQAVENSSANVSQQPSDLTDTKRGANTLDRTTLFIPSDDDAPT